METEAEEELLCGRYELRALLGRGGFGQVYEGLDRRSGERVALKALTQVGPDGLSAFKREFRAVQELHHPNLVRLDALFEARGRWWMAMELVDGTDLLAHVRGDGEPAGIDQARLRAAFSELAKGLNALHAAGFVHRDLKPSNVRVTAAGRVVLLDFGLAVAVDPGAQTNRHVGFGTVTYMAPEQAATTTVGPAADWYAFGVCMYEALTGVLPVDGESAFEILAAKQRLVAPPASSRVERVPADLDRLCSALLAARPEDRPDGTHVQSALAPTHTVSPGALDAGAAPSHVYEGREQELDTLRAAFEQTASGQRVVVLVDGESGIGKTALCNHFLSTRSDALVLRSRCYENELLGYKAFDGAIDALVRVLSKLPATETRALLPARTRMLCRLFPVFEALPPVRNSALPEPSSAPNVQRHAAFSTFIELLANLGARSPVVFFIDDLQWADTESFRLLETWLQASAARCLILATVRPQAELEGDAAERVAGLRQVPGVQSLSLSGLPKPTATAFVQRLVSPSTPPARVDMIVRESGGHPLFMTVLASHSGRSEASADLELTLDAAITAQLGALSTDARRLLSAAGLSGTPRSSSVCGRAAGLREAALGPIVSELCRISLLRRRGAGEIACFHDRIRHVVLSHVPAAESAALHRGFAQALAELDGVDPSEIARHHEAGGELLQAHAAYVRAAKSASYALAFARAALLYCRALEVAVQLELPTEGRCELEAARAEALARAGRSAEAAQQYAQAAEHASGEHKTRLKIFAAQHLLQAARFEQGLTAAHAVLSEIGAAMPTSRGALLGRVVWDRACLALAGAPHSPAATSAAEVARGRNRLDALSELALPLSWYDPILSAAISARHARLAHAAADPTHMARALAESAFSRIVHDPFDPEAERLLVRARTLAAQCDDPTLEVRIAFREANGASMRWDLFRALERLEHAERVALERCSAEPWLLTTVRISMGGMLYVAGDVARLAACSTQWVADARDRDDRFAIALYETLGFGIVRYILADDPERANATIDAAVAPWPREPFAFVHQGEAAARMGSLLYCGGERAQCWLEREHKRLSSSFLLKIPFGQTLSALWHGLAALAAIDVRDAQSRPALVAQTRAAIRIMERKKSAGYGSMMAHDFRAHLALLEGDVATALHHLQLGQEQARHGGYKSMAHGMQYLQGTLVGGSAGAVHCAQALEFFTSQGCKQPKRSAAVGSPAINWTRITAHARKA